jgi:uncharacterized membrane protein YfcA
MSRVPGPRTEGERMPPSVFHHPLFLILMGLIVGVYSGLMGLGGGSVMIPMMVFLLGFPQAMAHGTSLAVMIPPVVLPAVIQYYKAGKADLYVAAFMAVGVIGGSWVGAKLATSIQDSALMLVFGFVLIYVAGYTIFASLFGKEEIRKSMAFSFVLLGVSVGIYFVAREFAGVATARG